MKISKIYILLLAAIVIVACDPLEDVNKEIEDNFAYTNDISYTLVEDDYSDMGQDFPNFSSEDDATSLIPAFLGDRFPALGNGSSALVNYDIYRGSEPGISQYTKADTYEVSTADYASVDVAAGEAGFFNNSFTSEDNIPTILSSNVASPADGDLVAVNYEYASIEYADISGVVIFSEDFQSGDASIPDPLPLQTVSLEGAQDWFLYSSSAGYQAARISGYSGGAQPNEDWMITPEIDLTDHADASLKLSHVINFASGAVLGTDLAVKISTDYNGTTPSTATWTNLTLDQWPAGDSYDIMDSEVSLADYEDQKVFIAFYYKSTVDQAAQWRVLSIVVDRGEEIITNSKNDFYEYSASSTSWSAAGDEVYFLASADYDAMGAPGRFNNFSSSSPASDYLPAYLSANYPYAQEDDNIYIIYQYFSSSSGAGTRGDFYTLTNGSWSSYASVVTNSFSFGNEGGTWVPDNTIKYPMSGDDYAFVGNAYETSNSAGAGSISQYGNYDLSLWTDDQIQESIILLVTDLFPGVEGQKYLVTYATWEPGAGSGTVHLIYEGGAYILFVK